MFNYKYKFIFIFIFIFIMDGSDAINYIIKIILKEL